MQPSTRTVEFWTSAIKPGERYRYIYHFRGSLWLPKTFSFKDGTSTMLAFERHLDVNENVMCAGTPFFITGRNCVGVPIMLDGEPGRIMLFSVENSSPPSQVFIHLP